MPTVQIFGVKNSQATRAAERFFKERRVAIQFVDLKQKPIAPGEIKRFIDRFGWTGLLDTEGKAYINAGLKYLKVGERELMAKIESEPDLLRLPLIRAGNKLSVGHDERLDGNARLLNRANLARSAQDAVKLEIGARSRITQPLTSSKAGVFRRGLWIEQETRDVPVAQAAASQPDHDVVGVRDQNVVRRRLMYPNPRPILPAARKLHRARSFSQQLPSIGRDSSGKSSARWRPGHEARGS